MSEQRAEFVYTTYIRTTPQKVWDAITNPEFCRQYWGYGIVSDFTAGSKWDMVSGDGSGRVQTTGEVLESHPPTRLVLSWVKPDNRADRSEYSRVTFEIEVRRDDVVRLHIVHDQLKAGSEMHLGISDGWPRVLAGLKSYLETGQGLLLMCPSSTQAQSKVA
jgi:uncharacterized protein YndB with AHSA1/START domain